MGLISIIFGIIMLTIPSHYININEVVQAIKKEKKRRKYLSPDAEIGGTGQQFLGTQRTSENPQNESES